MHKDDESLNRYKEKLLGDANIDYNDGNHKIKN
jgi:hypothetical protein